MDKAEIIAILLPLDIFDCFENIILFLNDDESLFIISYYQNIIRLLFLILFINFHIISKCFVSHLVSYPGLFI